MMRVGSESEKKDLNLSPINPLPHNPHFQRPWKRSLLKTVGKGENAGHQHFLLFPQFRQQKKSPF